jgi:hypothetical protein
MSLQTSPSAPPTIVERFDPFSTEYLADPYPTLHELRPRRRGHSTQALSIIGSSRITRTSGIS